MGFPAAAGDPCFFGLEVCVCVCAVYLSVGEVPVESIGMHCPVL